MKNPFSTHLLPILTALGSSVCCITPILAVTAGTSGLASTFTWLEPARPFFIGATVVVLGLAWYGQLKHRKEVNCDCTNNIMKQNFWQGKRFLGVITLLAVLLLSLPMYSFVFFSTVERNIASIQQGSMETLEFTIKGMSCISCEKPVSIEINKLQGIITDSVSYAKSNAVVKFDKTKTSVDQIEKAITSRGYAVVKQEVK